eukprot:353209-Chlamydomonas_euryale.AAC.1
MASPVLTPSLSLGTPCHSSSTHLKPCPHFSTPARKQGTRAAAATGRRTAAARRGSSPPPQRWHISAISPLFPHLRKDRDVCKRQLQRADALLLRDEARDVTVDLGREEALGADRREPQHAVQSGRGRLAVGQRHGHALAKAARKLVRLGRHLAEH